MHTSREIGLQTGRRVRFDRLNVITLVVPLTLSELMLVLTLRVWVLPSAVTCNV